MTVLISGRAEGDLARIYAELAVRYDIGVAEAFRGRVENALGQLGLHPFASLLGYAP